MDRAPQECEVSVRRRSVVRQAGLMIQPGLFFALPGTAYAINSGGEKAKPSRLGAGPQKGIHFQIVVRRIGLSYWIV